MLFRSVLFPFQYLICVATNVRPMNQAGEQQKYLERIEAGTGSNEATPGHYRKPTTKTRCRATCFIGRFSVMARRGSIFSSALTRQETKSADQGIIVPPSIFAALSMVVVSS